MTTETLKIFTQLAGNWHFHRTLSTAGSVTGNAHFELVAPNILHYKEHGVFTTDTQKTYQVSREYGYCYDATQDKVAVYFLCANQLDYLFHELNFTSEKDDLLTATGIHVCREDRYSALYEFVHANEFNITYHVMGPRKNYVSTTVFKRN
ncbi:MAG TPA: DUF6314 family protein [Gammaproteobacteria bacterium]|nr:DUF6314 family protein [Gammaproteobacteria bacterium]